MLAAPRPTEPIRATCSSEGSVGIILRRQPLYAFGMHDIESTCSKMPHESDAITDNGNANQWLANRAFERIEPRLENLSPRRTSWLKFDLFTQEFEIGVADGM